MEVGGMIVEPDFADHWKTQALIRAVGDNAGPEGAPMMIIRLWAHCQHRKTGRFPNMSDDALAIICRWNRSPSELKAILIECGFINNRDGILTIHDWENTNRILVSAWKNGTKGGRPRKPTAKPTGNQSDNRTGTDRLTDPSNLSTLKEGVRGRFQEWIEIRMKMKKPKDPAGMFAKQIEWLNGFPENDQVEILNQSIRNGYQGLFAPKHNETHQRPYRKVNRNIGTRNEGMSSQYAGIGQIK
jgi:hypothetical protein